MHSIPPRRPRARARLAVQITDRDRQLLAFVAENPFVLATQVAMLLELTDAAADARLRALDRGGYVVREHALYAQPTTARITREGLRAIGSDLPAARPLNLGAYHHELGVGWLQVAARRGRFGPLQAVVSERRMRSDDGRPAEGRQRHGVRLGGVGPRGRDRLHYPDLVLLTDTGHRIAFELELTSKARPRREGILAGYAADPRIDMVIYLVDRPATGRAITQSAERLGMSHLVRVQNVSRASPPTSRGSRTAGRHVPHQPTRRRAEETVR